MPDSLKLNSSDGKTLLTGLAGRGILSSRSPWLHEREAEAQGAQMRYELFDFDDRGWTDAQLNSLIAEAQDNGFVGLNITFPFKQAVIAFLDDLSDGARSIGAVNTVSFKNGRKIGYNTDVTGFAESVRQGLGSIAGQHVVQLGCGGAGSATAQALLELGVRLLSLFETDAARLDGLVAKLQSDFGKDRITAGTDIARAANLCDGIVNATPIGMAKLPGLPLSADLLEQRHWVADIVYFPLETELLREAKLRGCRVLNGSGMAVEQAAAAFEIFTGFTPERPRMQNSFAEYATRSASCVA